MELSVFHRVVLLNILPREGDITTLKLVRKLREDLSFTEEEHAALEFRQDGERLEWKTEADKPKEIEMGDKAREIIRNRLKELNGQKKLSEDHVDLYDRFVEAYENGG